MNYKNRLKLRKASLGVKDIEVDCIIARIYGPFAYVLKEGPESKECKEERSKENTVLKKKKIQVFVLWAHASGTNEWRKSMRQKWTECGFLSIASDTAMCFPLTVSTMASGINYHLLSTHYVSGYPRAGIIISLCPHSKHDVGANKPIHSFLRFRKLNLL